MPNCDFNRVVKIAHRHECSSVNLLYIFRTHFDKNTCEGVLLAERNWRYRKLSKSRDHGEIKFVDKIYPQFIFVEAEKCHMKPGTRNLTPVWHVVSRIGHLEPGTWHLVSGTWNLTLGSWHLEPGIWHLRLEPTNAMIKVSIIFFFFFIQFCFPLPLKLEYQQQRLPSWYSDCMWIRKKLPSFVI